MPDFVLYTDGSGYTDGFSGYCAILVCTVPKLDATSTVMGSMSGSSVDRAEMMALLEGLEAILNVESSLPRFRIADRKIQVTWFSDRESLVKSVKNEYGRNSSKDLWARLAYYETKFEIDARWVERETDYPEFQACDLHASTQRVILKSYIATL